MNRLIGVGNNVRHLIDRIVNTVFTDRRTEYPLLSACD